MTEQATAEVPDGETAERAVPDDAATASAPAQEERPPWLARARAAVLARPRLAVVLVVVLLAGAAGAGWWWTHRGLPDGVALRVGEQEVAVSDVEERMTTLEALYGVEVPDGDAADQFWRDAAQSVAVSLVLDDLAAEEGVTVTDQRVQASLDQYVTTFFGEGDAGREAYVQALSTSGVAEDAVTDEVRRQLVLNDLFALVTVEAEAVTDTDLQCVYDARGEELTVPEQREVRNIVVADEATAGAVLEQLRGGADFGAVAAATSLDASTKDAGGALGTLSASDLEPAYAEAAFGVEEGGLFGPVQSQFGWNVGQVVAVRAPRLPPLPEIAEDLRATTFAKRQTALWRDWLADRLREADVEYADAYRPDDPYALPASGGGAAGSASGGGASGSASGAGSDAAPVTGCP